MCGITGFWTPGGLDARAGEWLAGMTSTLVHRGPEGGHQHLDPRLGLGLGHTRLALNDLAETGAQPLVSEDGSVLLTVNGEFYDFKRHRARMMALGDRFRTRSDSEIAIGLYRRFGLDFVDHLRGEFAFALFDRERRELILVRDRFGIRPLFFHLRPERIVWGSEVKAVLAHPEVPRRLSRRAALNQMMHTMVPGTSAFEDVHALEPGHLMVVRQDGDRLRWSRRRWWDLDFPAEGEHARLSDDEHVERIREELIQAVRLRLEADVPVGCYLSGGIDSCSILGLASGAQQSPVKAFTISFDDDAYDEAAIAVEMAESMDADQELIRLGADDLYGDNYLRTVWHAERTFYNTLGVAKWCMSRRVHECGYKTVITGEGADELFGGYPAFKRDMYLHGMGDGNDDDRRRYQEALERSNKLFKGAILAESEQSHPAWEELCGFTPSWLQPWLTTLAEVEPLMAAEVREELEGFDPVAAIAEAIDPEAVRGRHPLDRAQYTWAKTMLEGQILNWGGDRVDMANSMESRPAFLDHHLAEAAMEVPPELRIRGTTEKWVLREAIRGVLPETLYRREKFAFMAPPAHTDERKRRRLDDLTGEFLSAGAIAGAGLFDPGAVAAFLETCRTDSDPVALTRRDKILNHLLCLQILHRQFIDGEPPPPVPGGG
jgi:asparagine synthase (glutamine-hydrolysing)